MKPSLHFHQIHFVGIGGSGMSSLAEIMYAWGFEISGSDSQENESVSRLRKLGCTINMGHNAAAIKNPDAVVFSSAIPKTNVEVVEAAHRSIPLIRRAEMMGEIIRGKYAFGVAGTHGKTTTTTMLGSIWKNAGKDPTLLAGGITRGENLSAVAGQSNTFIFEADEFDRSFLAMRPTSAIIGNIDSDHLDCYGTFAEIQKAFTTFAGSIPFYGRLVVNADDAGVQSILHTVNKPSTIKYGVNSDSQYRASEIKNQGQGMVFTLAAHDKILGEIQLQVPGLHNVYNALAAATLSLEEGLTFSQVAFGLKEFKGVKRRLEFKGQKSGVTFYDDYAHHPTEVTATLEAARKLGTGRLIVVFQPHLYSRTQQLYREFALAFSNCDEVFVTSIYPAREKPIPGVEGSLITEAIKNVNHSMEKVNYLTDLSSIPKKVSSRLSAGDVVVTMGAGDIGEYCLAIMEALP